MSENTSNLYLACMNNEEILFPLIDTFLAGGPINILNTLLELKNEGLLDSEDVNFKNVDWAKLVDTITDSLGAALYAAEEAI
jgi:hypothetical protein